MNFKTTVVLIVFLGYVTKVQAVVPPYFEDFESESGCIDDCTVSCPINALGWFNEDLFDDKDWLANKGPTASPNSGPDVDHTTGDESGFYLYVHSVSSPCSNEMGVSILISPFLELSNTQNPQASFWYHMFGQDVGLLHIDVLNAGLNPIQIDVIQPISDNIDLWQKMTVDLTDFVPQSIFLRFRHVHSGTGSEGDVAIDDFEFIDDLDLIFRDGFE